MSELEYLVLNRTSLSRHVSLHQMQLLLETFSNTDEMSVLSFIFVCRPELPTVLHNSLLDSALQKVAVSIPALSTILVSSLPASQLTLHMFVFRILRFFSYKLLSREPFGAFQQLQ